jgi:cytochrome c
MFCPGEMDAKTAQMEDRVMKSFVAAPFVIITFGAALLSAPGSATAVDVEAAKALARQNNCFKCHGIEKEKDGPAWAKVAEKYRGQADAQEKLIHHITSGEKAKFPDGHEEDHKIVKTDPPNDAAQIKNLIDWILSL